MATKKNRLFVYIKKKFFFLCLPKSDPERELRKRRWRWPFGMPRLRECPVPVPVLVQQPKTTLDEAIKEQRKHALKVAIAAAAAAEAAIAAAHAAAEVVRLTGASSEQKFRRCGLDPDSAATSIQSAFRAYLGRKALRALKGPVKLQALARVRAVRRRRDRPLNCSPTTSPWSKPGSTHSSTSLEKEHSRACEYDEAISKFKKEVLKIRCSGWRSWDQSMSSKEDVENNWLRQQDARSRRERMMQYSYSQREGRNAQISVDPSWSKRYSRWSLRGRTWDNNETVRPLACSTSRWMEPEEGTITPCFLPRRSFGHARKSSLDDEVALPSLPVFPAYMAVTQIRQGKSPAGQHA